MSERILFFLASLGVVLTIHIWIQRQKGYAEGCWGSRKLLASSGCGALTQAPEPRLLGLPPVVLGFIFYACAALLSFSTAVMPGLLGSGSKSVQDPLWLLGFIASVYYTGYQYFKVKALCVLCALSSALVLLGSIVLLLPNILPETPREVWLARALPGQETAYFALLGMTVFVLGLGMFVFLNRVGLRPIHHPDNKASFVDALDNSLGLLIDAKELQRIRPCRFAQPRKVIGEAVLENLLRPFQPFQAGSGLTAVYLFNPVCAASARGIQEFRRFVEQSEGLRSFIIPIALNESSMLPAAAMLEANREGAYGAFLEAYFEKPQPGWYEMNNLMGIANRVGLDSGSLASRLEAGKADVYKMAEGWKEQGLNQLPQAILDGIVVYQRSSQADCLSILFKRRLAFHERQTSLPED